MDDKVVDLKKFKIEAKKRQIKEKVREAWEFAKEHPAESLALATATVGGLTGLIKRADRHSAIRKEQELKDRYIYDRSIGKYGKTRKVPSTGQQLEIERRKKNGESMGDILSSMRLL